MERYFVGKDGEKNTACHWHSQKVVHSLPFQQYHCIEVTNGSP